MKYAIVLLSLLTICTSLQAGGNNNNNSNEQSALLGSSSSSYIAVAPPPLHRSPPPYASAPLPDVERGSINDNNANNNSTLGTVITGLEWVGRGLYGVASSAYSIVRPVVPPRLPGAPLPTDIYENDETFAQFWRRKNVPDDIQQMSKTHQDRWVMKRDCADCWKECCGCSMKETQDGMIETRCCGCHTLSSKECCRSVGQVVCVCGSLAGLIIGGIYWTDDTDKVD